LVSPGCKLPRGSCFRKKEKKFQTSLIKIEGGLIEAHRCTARGCFDGTNHRGNVLFQESPNH